MVTEYEMTPAVRAELAMVQEHIDFTVSIYDALRFALDARKNA